MKKFCSFDDIAACKTEILQKALSAKQGYQNDPESFLHVGRHKTVGLVFLNPSLRTRVSSQRAANNLGMHSIVINMSGDSWGLEFDDNVVMNGTNAEHIKEAAATLGSYCDILAVRSFSDFKSYDDDKSQRVLNAFIQYSGVPVVNLESPLAHPLQALTDIMTIEETIKISRKPKIVLSWAPHCRALPQAVANSFSSFALGYDMDLTITHPPGFELDPEFTGGAKITHDQKTAFEDADVVYAKNWASIKDYGRVGGLIEYSDWTICADKMKLTNSAKFMHCLPVRRNLVVTDDVIESESSVVIQQAANRVWVAQAIFKEILEGECNARKN